MPDYGSGKRLATGACPREAVIAVTAQEPRALGGVDAMSTSVAGSGKEAMVHGQA